MKIHQLGLNDFVETSNRVAYRAEEQSRAFFNKLKGVMDSLEKTIFLPGQHVKFINLCFLSRLLINGLLNTEFNNYTYHTNIKTSAHITEKHKEDVLSSV